MVHATGLQSPMLQSPRPPLSAVQPNLPGRVVTPSKSKTPQPSKPSELVTPSGLKPDAKGSPVTTLAASQRGAAPIALPVVPGYDLVSQLGRGGFGAVYLAHTPRLGEEVAIKLVFHGGRKAGAEERFACFDADEAEHEASIHRRLSAGTEVTS